MVEMKNQTTHELPDSASLGDSQDVAVTLLTGGSDKHYAYGLAMELISKGAVLDVIGSDELEGPEFQNRPGLTFYNLRGDQGPNASVSVKVYRVLKYYVRLIYYAATAKPKIFHILWNNRFETFDRTLLMLYYRFLGKRIVFTAHNVNTARRDCTDNFLNRVTLTIQYHLCNQIFVHTDKMKAELLEVFGVRGLRVTVIPYGINNAVPNTDLNPSEARRQLGFGDGERTILFFGRIRPSKGLEYLVAAFRQISRLRDDYRLIIAGSPDSCQNYWKTIRESIREDMQSGRILLKSEFIPDDQTELYFKAADVLVLPYRHIYQSGILFLGQSFGLPVLAADVGSLKNDIVDGKTGFVFRPEDPTDLASTLERYFASNLFAHLMEERQNIQRYATAQHSWSEVGQITMNVYTHLAPLSIRENAQSSGRRSASSSEG
jgi:glycosyltransferase involved in cell wall biosynthesis